MARVKSVLEFEKNLEYKIVCEDVTFHITAADFRLNPLSEGDTVDGALYEFYEKASTKLKCIKKAFAYLEYGDMSEKKLFYKLTKHFDRDTSSAVVALMREKGYVDDKKTAYEFALRYYLESRLGVMRIRAKLYEGRFSAEAIQYALDELEQTENFENMSFLLEQKYGDFSKPSREEKEKMSQYLTRMGYTYSDINEFFRYQ